mmetsp:Transcript_20925/g.53218  ORF Transcript_20925/g.53218 Transcript_20925/m.53218 type:complete len:273 (+) Transcript_20925:52-870(+)
MGIGWTCYRKETVLENISDHLAVQPIATTDPEPEGMAGVRYYFFDFDQTISRCHVFKQLAGWEKHQFVPPPFAQSDRGQIHRIGQLQADRWVYDERVGRIAASPKGGTWTSAALGGPERVEDLRQFFRELRENGAILTIVTKGYVGAVRKTLHEEGLLQFFHHIYGNVGKEYGEAALDRENPPVSEFEGTRENALTKSKAALIAGLLREARVKGEEAVLVEDDPREIESVERVCRSVFVQERRGMTLEHLVALRQMAAPRRAAGATAGRGAH